MSEQKIRHIKEGGRAGQTRIAIDECKRRGLPIWDHLSSETDLSFQRFCAYRDLGPRRSLAALTVELGLNTTKDGKSPGNLDQMSHQNAWVERARAYDEFLTKDRHNSLVNEAMDVMVLKWGERQGSAREEQYVVGQMMLRLAKERVGAALGIRFLPGGGTEPLPEEDIKPLDALEKDPAKFVRAAVAITQSALYLPARSRNDGEQAATEGLLTLPTDLQEASDEELITFKANYDRNHQNANASKPNSNTSVAHAPDTNNDKPTSAG